MKKLVAVILSAVLLTSPVYGADTEGNISSWAVSDINKAYEYGLIEGDFLKDYGEPVTRRDFCRLCAGVINKAIESGLNYRELSVESVSFEDIADDDSQILICAGLGIVNGTGDNRFEPDKPITRQEAAKMLYNTYDVLTGRFSEEDEPANLPHIFEDGEEISAWARKNVYAMYHLGIMQGDEKNCFDPYGNYTGEQAIASFVRLYESVSDPEAGYIDEIYPTIEASKYFLSNSTGQYALTVPYAYNEVRSELNIQYTDGRGSVYNSDEMGCIYPLDKQYSIIHMGLNETGIIDRYGDIFLPNDIKIRDIYSLEGDIAVLEVGRAEAVYNGKRYNGGYKVFNLRQGKEIDLGNGIEYIYPLREDMYFAEWGRTGEAGCYLDGDFDPVTENIYRYGYGTFNNGLCIAEKYSGGYIIINSQGQELKSFDYDRNRSLKSACGEIAIEIVGDEQEVVNRMTDTAIGTFGYADFLPDGRIFALSDGYACIYNRDGSLDFDGSQAGYTEIRIYHDIDDVFMAKNDTSWYALNSEGQILTRTDDADLIYDGGGVYCAALDGSTLITFDKYGSRIGEINIDGLHEFAFVNGIIRTVSEEDQVSYFTQEGVEVTELFDVGISE